MKQTNHQQTQSRKLDHIHLCEKEDVESTHKQNGLENWQLQPVALPEISLDEIDTTASYLNHSFCFPIHITGMTGGVDKAQLINERLAQLATKYSIPMGVGSQRAALESASMADSFKMKQSYPDVFLMGNLGIYQLCEVNGLQQAIDAVDMIRADAMAIHINILQEQIQNEGDRTLKAPFQQIEKLCKMLRVPVIIKEVGCGIDVATAKRLRDVGVTAVDVGGHGGTSWGYIEGMRNPSPVSRRLGQTFRDWGISTAKSLVDLKQNIPDLAITATGGIRTGVDVAKAVALGAQSVGIGLPFFKAALDSFESLDMVMQSFIKELKIAMLCTNCEKLSDLKKQIRYISHNRNH